LQVFFAAFPLADEACCDVEIAGEDGLARAFSLTQCADLSRHHHPVKPSKTTELDRGPIRVRV
jgi:hypothetical protein